jgi:hypothetical protein
MTRQRSGSGFGRRSWLFLGLLAVGLVYATATGRWSTVIYLLLRVS